MEFPTLVYQVPGIHRGPGNTSFNFREAADEEAFDALTADGWFATLDEAANPPVIEAIKDDLSDRELLEAEARRIGIGFNWKTTDAALSEKITEAMKGQQE